MYDKKKIIKFSIICLFYIIFRDLYIFFLLFVVLLSYFLIFTCVCEKIFFIEIVTLPVITKFINNFPVQWIFTSSRITTDLKWVQLQLWTNGCVFRVLFVSEMCVYFCLGKLMSICIYYIFPIFFLIFLCL